MNDVLATLHLSGKKNLNNQEDLAAMPHISQYFIYSTTKKNSIKISHQNQLQSEFQGIFVF